MPTPTLLQGSITMIDIGYVITSHGDYSVPLNHMFKNLPLSFPIDQCVIISGGHEYRDLEDWNGIPRFITTHNSWDYTSLIEIIENDFPWLPKKLFFLQDTMIIGTRTHELVSDIGDFAAVAAFGGQCNLCLYDRDYLSSQWNFIQARRNCSKLDSIIHEGALWKTCPPQYRSHYNPDNAKCDIIGIGKPYDNAERITEYYNAVDILKFKANYGQNMHALIHHP
jgi:hypothetical protein